MSNGERIPALFHKERERKKKGKKLSNVNL